MWGGIAVGKSTASTQLLAELTIQREQMVDMNVDFLVQKVPEYIAARIQGGDVEKEAYMKYRGAGKAVQMRVAHEAVEKGVDLYVEWTNEDNLHALSRDESNVFSKAALEAKGYTVVVCLVECRDIEGILKAASEREKVDGRHIPESVIVQFNKDRAKHFMQAIGASVIAPMRSFVLTRKQSDADGTGMVEVTDRELLTGEFDEQAARDRIDALMIEMQLQMAASGPP
jgi:hypothetical protein